jgi:hypothetical protein
MGQPLLAFLYLREATHKLAAIGFSRGQNSKEVKLPRYPPAGASPDEAAAEIRDVVDSIGDTARNACLANEEPAQRRHSPIR